MALDDPVFAGGRSWVHGGSLAGVRGFIGNRPMESQRWCSHREVLPNLFTGMKFNRSLSRVGIVLLALSLMGSGLLNIQLYKAAQQYYRELNSTRLDPLGLKVYPRQPHPQVRSHTDRIKVVFFGDSRAFAWTEPSNLDRFESINRGIGAQTTSQVLGRYDRHIRPLNANILVLQVGINDLKTIPLFPHLKENIISQSQANIEQIVRQAQRQNTVVIVSTIFPVGEVPLTRRLFWSPDADAAIEQVNAFIHQLAAKQVIVFDTAAILANDKGRVKDDYGLDFLHLNETGYQALNRELVPLLQQVAAREKF